MKKKNALITITLLPVLFAALYFSVSGNPSEPVRKSTAGGQTAGNALELKQELYSFKVEGFNRDQKAKWELEGRSADLSDKTIVITDLKAVYYEGDNVFTLFSDRAVYHKESRDVELFEKVTGRSSDGGALYTDYAVWNAEEEEITTESRVVVKRENVTCVGEGMVTRPKLKWVALKRDITVDFGEKKSIACKGPFEIDHEKHVAVFNNEVVVIDDKSEMFTDRLTAFLNPETNEVENVVTEGGVRVVHRGDIKNIGDFAKAAEGL